VKSDFDPSGARLGRKNSRHNYRRENIIAIMQDRGFDVFVNLVQARC